MSLSPFFDGFARVPGALSHHHNRHVGIDEHIPQPMAVIMPVWVRSGSQVRASSAQFWFPVPAESELPMRPDFQVVLLTGSAKGLGKVMGLDVLKNGGRLVAVDQDGDALESFKALAKSVAAEQALHCVRCDLTDAAAPQRVLDEAFERFSRVDVLINNAGIGRSAIGRDIFTRPPPFWEADVDVWRRFFEIHVHACFQLMKGVVPQMLERSCGSIINISTSLESTIRAGGTAYGASKAGLESLSAIAANDLAGTGVVVNVLVPGGPTDTPMIPADAPYARSALLPAEIMSAPLLWLLSEEARPVSGKRIDASKWDSSLQPFEAAARAMSPVGWTQIAGKMRVPIVQM